MMGRGLSCEIDVNHIPVLPGARESADAFLYTAAGQRNRNHVGAAVQFENVSVFKWKRSCLTRRPPADF